ncbi:MAG TPA: methyltransferase domain-containing protein [Sphingomicrobium sp.]|nr:methyltransferase domain-containing protein [Sphingomicrobium sp.]
MKPHDLSNRFRQKWMRRFLELLKPLQGGRIRILDLGGTAAYWHALPGLYRDENVEITIINLDDREFDDANLKVRQGDARNLPQFADNSFDVVHSNSVIEHVGLWGDMQRMAAEVRRLAPRYFVQTPNYWFPIEPHYKLPLVQFLPRSVRSRIRDKVWPGQSIELIAAKHMRTLFPDAGIERERFCGLTKSLIAVKQ